MDIFCNFAVIIEILLDNPKTRKIMQKQIQGGLMMRDFAAIDFETANNERTSVCSVGVVIVRDGEIIDSFYSLIQPEPNYYNYWCTQVHGLQEKSYEMLDG
jgi:DNA polymerase III epsilon subunit-like protein